MTVDLLVEDVDFRRESAPPRLLGHKALAVSLSDIAAMGARPRWALLSIGVPEAVWQTSFLEEFYQGFHALAAKHGVTLVGGDVSRTPERIVIDSIVVGEAPSGRAIFRTGAQAGDRIFVTGALGGARAGLELLESGTRMETVNPNRLSPHRRSRFPEGGRLPVKRETLTRRTARERLLLRQLRPTPRVVWGQTLGEKRLATAMIDLSDGLSSDLAHLCRESGVGALLQAARIPVDSSIAPAGKREFDGLALALDGGEDYELLFTVSPQNVSRLPRRVAGVYVTEIGEVRDASEGLRLVEQGRERPLEPAGYEHFGGRSI